jgi:hypothetical protein
MDLSEKAWAAEPATPEEHASDPDYIERRGAATTGMLGSNPPGSLSLETVKSLTKRLLGGQLELRPTGNEFGSAGYGIVDPKQPDRKLANLDVASGERFLGKWHPLNPKAKDGTPAPTQQLIAPSLPGGALPTTPAPAVPPAVGTSQQPRMTGAGPVVDAPSTGQAQPPPWFAGTAKEWWERQNRPPTGPVPQNITIDPSRPQLNRP